MTRRLPTLTLLVCAPLAACSGKEDTGDPPDLIVDDTGEAKCGENPPTITSVTVVNAGMHDFEGATYAAMEIDVAATDPEDGDLHLMETDLWWDTTVDGAVDTSGTPNFDGDYVLTRDMPCDVASSTGIVYVPVREGGTMLAATQYEVAAIVGDGSGDHSAVAIGTGWSPNYDGTDGAP